MKTVLIALLSAATLAVAQPHAHNHAHRHPARNGSPLEARDPAVVTETAAGPMVTVYELNGDDIPYNEVEEGLKNGKYVLVGGEASIAAPSTSSTPTPTPSPTSQAAKFFQKPVEPSSSTHVAPTTHAAPKPKPSPTYVAAPPPPPPSSPSVGNGGSGVDSDFPDNVPCSTFPSKYGAVAAEWLGLEGWLGVQEVPGYTFDLLSSTNLISYLATAISGGCHPGSFCSYACPAGYQKLQWPTSQGATGQSIGGLFCNSKGFLELTNPEHKKLCGKGVGGVSVKNNLSQNACICRTDYPGTESETVALDTQPGQTYDLTCPDAHTYYKWEGASTSAQYYINPAGAPVHEACTWGSAGTNLGNWAPINAGVGRGTDGITYISLFRNAPTNPDGTLTYAVEITGDVSGKCSFDGKTFWNNGVESPTGCTVAIHQGGEAVFEFNSS